MATEIINNSIKVGGTKPIEEKGKNSPIFSPVNLARMFCIFFAIRQIAIEYSMLYIMHCKNATRQLSSAASIMRGHQHFKTASQFALDQTLRGLTLHGPGPELATEFIFFFFL